MPPTPRSRGTFLRKLVVRTLVGVAALVVVVIVALAGRLADGPVPLPFLVPRIEEGLASLAPDALANVGHVELVWTRRRPEIRVLDLRLLTRDGSPIASLPALTVRPSLRAALQGRAAMAGLGLIGARVALARTPEGTLILGGDSAAEDERNTAALLALLLERNRRATPSRHHDLTWIHIRDARLVLEDARLHLTWRANEAQVFLRLAPDHIEAHIDGELIVEGTSEEAPVRELVVPLAATVDVWRDGEGKLASVKFEARGAAGRVTAAAEERPHVVLDALEVQGAYSHDARAVTLEHVRASLGTAEVEATARLPFAPGEPLQAKGTVAALAAEDLPALWPPKHAGGAREWIARNVHGGTVTNATFALSIPPRAERTGPLPSEAVDVRFDLEGLEVTYLKEHEPLRELSASAHLSADRFTADVHGGNGSGLAVDGGALDVDLSVRPVQAKIQADVHGTNTDMLAVLDRHPLFIPKKLGIAPGEVTGDGNAHVEIEMPFARGVSSKDVRVKADGTLRNVRAPDLFVGVGIADADLDVAVDGRRVRIRGTTTVTDAPLSPGVLGVDATVEPKVGTVTRVHGTVTGESIATTGELIVDEHGLRTVELPDLRYGRNDLSARLARAPDGYCRAWLSGKVADIEPLIERLRAPQPEEGSKPPSRLRWDLELDVERVLTGHRDVELSDVDAQAAGVGDDVDVLLAVGRLAGERGGAFRLDLETHDDKRSLSLSASDGGAVIDAFGLSKEIEGGQLAVAASISGRGSERTTTGEIELSEFRVVRAPLLAELLSLGSLQGIANVLNREGIPFTRARVPFQWAAGTFEINEARAVGSIGITADGAIETDSGVLDLVGQIIPAYTLNSALGKVPILGRLLVGDEGEGVFGIAYQVEGQRSAPKINVNPLTALAPGRLRQMFVEPFSRNRDAQAREPADAPGAAHADPSQPLAEQPEPGVTAPQ